MLVERPKTLTNIQQLLDQLGTPPPEVCLDWAWQLLNHPTFSQGQGTQLHGNTLSADQASSSLDPVLPWSQWVLSESGELKLEQLDSDQPSCAAHSHSSLPMPIDPTATGGSPQADSIGRARMIAQLLDWAGAAWREDTNRFASDVQWRVLGELKRKLLNSSSTSHRHQATSFSFNASLQSESKEKLRSKKRRNLGPRQYWQPKHFLIGVLVPIIAIGGYGYWSRFRLRELSTFQSPDIQSRQSSVDFLGLELQTIDPPAPDDVNSEAIEAHFSEPIRASISRSQVADFLGGLETIPEAPDGSGFSLTDGSASNALPDATWSGAINDGVLESATGAVQTTIAEIDTQEVLANVIEELTKGITPGQPAVTDLSIEPNAKGTQAVPAQLISTSSMMQVQRLPGGFRVREPEWQLQLVPSDSFAVDTQAPQRLWGRAIASWTLLPTEFSQRKSEERLQVLVQAQMAGNRPDIRWKISASPRDLPTIVLPMNAAQLEHLFDILTEQQGRCKAALDQVKMQGSQAGLPKELRGLLLNRRRFLEEQIKVLQRLEQVVADAVLYAAWLGESIEVHGVLIDNSTQEQPRTVLHLGKGISKAMEMPSP